MADLLRDRRISRRNWLCTQDPQIIPTSSHLQISSSFSSDAALATENVSFLVYWLPIEATLASHFSDCPVATSYPSWRRGNMKFSSASLLVLSTVGVNGQFFGSNSTNSTGFQGSIQPVGAVTQPPVVTPLTDSPSEEPTITPEPTDAPTPTPSVSNQDVCDDIDSDWEEWYDDQFVEILGTTI
jgi:hypothetical protein